MLCFKTYIVVILLRYQIDVETAEKPLYYSSGDEPDEDCLFYLPVAPEIDDPEGEMTYGYDAGKNSANENAKDAAAAAVVKSEESSSDIHDGPPSKKTKITDVNINGDSYNANGVLAGMRPSNL